MRRHAIALLLASSMAGCMSMSADNGGNPMGCNSGSPGCGAFGARVPGPAGVQCLAGPDGQAAAAAGPVCVQSARQRL